ncbi:MAG: hypothetical protein OXP12_06495 [Thaumarchaeota archaeon]|nr:hypothetical protein [Nitrososphaerota archaeon]MDE0526385.1 hypothetical protein [Nitrososphaerota archaeon]
MLCLGAGGASVAAEGGQPAVGTGAGPGPHHNEPTATAATPPAAASPPTTWRLGNGLEAGDSYTYEVCHSVHAAEATQPDPCYTLRMDFVYLMTHHAYGHVWVMDVGFDGKGTVMLLDHDTMTVYPTSAWDVWLAGSIRDTVLHLAPYGEQSLEVGAYWGEVDAYFYSVPLSVVSRDGDRSVLGYDTTAESQTVIVSGMPFPEYSRWHDPRSISADPRIMHEYALVR